MRCGILMRIAQGRDRTKPRRCATAPAVRDQRGEVRRAALLVRDDVVSRLEKRGRVLGRALLRHRLLQPPDFGREQRDALGDSSTDSSERSCPISWVIFFRGLSSSSIGMCPPRDHDLALSAPSW